MVDLDQHTGILRFVVEGCLKFDLQKWPQMTPRWPPIKNFWTSGKNLWLRISSPKFNQNLLNHVDKEAFWAYLNNDPNDPKWPPDDRWPQIPEHPYCPPTWWSLHPSITKIHHNIFKKKHFLIVNGWTDRQTHQYTISSSHLRCMS